MFTVDAPDKKFECATALDVAAAFCIDCADKLLVHVTATVALFIQSTTAPEHPDSALKSHVTYWLLLFI